MARTVPLTRHIFDCQMRPGDSSQKTPRPKQDCAGRGGSSGAGRDQGETAYARGKPETCTPRNPGCTLQVPKGLLGL